MRVHVHPTRGNKLTVGMNGSLRRFIDFADCGNLSSVNGDIAHKRLATASIYNLSTFDQ